MVSPIPVSSYPHPSPTPPPPSPHQTHSYCWTSTTYVLYDKESNTMFPQQDHAYFEYVDKPEFSKAFAGGAQEPPAGGKYQRVLVSYYRWTPVVLTIQALLFHAPFLIWHSFAIGAGIQIKCLMTAAKEISKVITIKNEAII